ncbi:chlorite dismutase [alpha proteobacterium AAP81b]|nr:chlorite dismutase [alpha proteobacterium AAP81b]
MPGSNAAPLPVAFDGGAAGQWRVDAIMPVIGASLPDAAFVAVRDARADDGPPPADGWRLQGFTSNLRYTKRRESEALIARQAGLGRPAASCAALIPITKSPAWWAMAQDERRAVFEAQSRHIAIGLDYLPGVARRLHHSRDLGEAFDFLTWFEFAPEETPAFDAMLARLRATPEWAFVDREVDIRLTRV